MPDYMLALDQHLPRFTGRETLENKVDQVARYEYELLRTLRYVIYHLDTRNFNMTEINRWMGTVTEPLSRRLEDAEGNITEIQITAKGIETTVRNQAGDLSRIRQTADKIQLTVQDQQKNISSIEQTARAIQMTVSSQTGEIAQLKITAQAIQSTVQDQAGNLSQLRQTAQAIQSTVSSQAGDLSRIQQTAAEISATVQSHGGDLSQLRQTAQAIQATVASQTGEISQLQITANAIQSTVARQEERIGTMIRQTVDSISLSVENEEGCSWISLNKNGIQAAAQRIEFTGMVTFDDLSQDYGRTIINGGIIDTRYLRLDTLWGNTIYLMGDDDREAAVLELSTASSYDGQKIVIRSGAIELSSTGNIYLASGRGGSLEVGDFEAQVDGDVLPSRGSTYDCGTYGFPWRDIYSQDGSVQSSDRAGKEEIDYDMSRYTGLFDRLRPCSFLRRNGSSGRRHHGFVAQDVEAALAAEGLTGMDFAGFVRWEGGCGLRYEETLAMLVYELQKLKRAVNGQPWAQAAT